MTDDEEKETERRAHGLRQAQGAAADLARMGIDPRTLGLDEAAEEPPGAAVVQLRPSATGATAPEVQTAPPVTEDDERPRSRVEQLLSRAFTDRPAPTRDTSRLFRTVARGVATVDAAVPAQEERDLVDAVRRRQGERRIVAFVAGQGGVGCTTLAVATGTTFMALREDHSVVIDVQSGTPSLGELYGAGAPAGVAALLARDEVATAPSASSGLGLVDGAGWDQALRRGDVAGVLDRLGEEHVFHVFDAGDDPGEASRAALARADQVVVVSGPGRAGSAAAGAALDRVAYVNPACLDEVIHAVVCRHEESYRETLRRAGEASQQGPMALVVVPPDPHLAGGSPFDAGQVTSPVRGAVLRLASAVALGGRG